MAARAHFHVKAHISDVQAVCERVGVRVDAVPFTASGAAVPGCRLCQAKQTK